MGRRPKTIEDRLKQIIVDDRDCWNWTGRLNKDGYGQLGQRIDGKCKKLLAHRYFYSQLKGDIPSGLTLDHLCRNRKCVNPDHLEPVTIKVNLLRGNTLQAKNAAKTHCKRGHPFNKQNTHLTPDNRRSCRKCRALRQREYMVRKKHGSTESVTESR